MLCTGKRGWEVTAVNRGPAISSNPNTQSVMGSNAIVRASLGTGTYDLDKANLPGYISGGTGIIEINATGTVTINSLSAFDAPINFTLTFINTGSGIMLFNNLGGTGSRIADSFQNMSAGQVAIYAGGAADFKRIIPSGSTQAYWIA